jgi:hypothetical protein
LGRDGDIDKAVLKVVIGKKARGQFEIHFAGNVDVVPFEVEAEGVEEF